VTATRRRPRPRGAYRPPRKRSEVITAIAAVVGVLVVTAALIWFLRPNDSETDSPNVPASVSVPSAPSVPPESVPPVESPPPAPPGT
jgi:hypothetical protein